MHRSQPIVLAALILAACGEAPAPTAMSGNHEIIRKDMAGLTQPYAEFRANQVGNVRYGLTVQLDSALDSFSGENRLSFDLGEDYSDLTIDFAEIGRAHV